ncbi:hypothetical protein C3747_95g265c [Trypanosoma cruzi]|uniref:Uncharacterized protein n=2 Tax=Trypanosoma cruzi TaxID=5693 RepID=Q4D207_TRYCC|nr:hypothetical protein, conserved [Trypanosoma cruzi]XP_816268.1 hypothetical protein, conserved [Trypanosoma cruzi]PBJ74750.1 hypothetical protein BCY84_12083 [Trypanosoma cruzi cruzi]EAN86567.1 hypothetical protein, conserved [Trypanosoma cruzi]EAN94417.1 hypothetical protein, conserved [Trypanosoma cruzi]KAF8280402.1 hypothetical protein TcBrA4_0096340 [Trypanosoma cruzi]KAF8296539.1 hypothetical protein TcYC6_0085740 [Trypanosoma cruzi]|eukprot:XP_808418.1 hypothetical protein [Trypanosoma cruzi strain CL Brener]
MQSRTGGHNISSIQKDQAYLHSHNVRGIIERLVADVLRDKPENACEYMAQWAARQRAAAASTADTHPTT